MKESDKKKKKLPNGDGGVIPDWSSEEFVTPEARKKIDAFLKGNSGDYSIEDVFEMSQANLAEASKQDLARKTPCDKEGPFGKIKKMLKGKY